jgi:hypothetical protein
MLVTVKFLDGRAWWHQRVRPSGHQQREGDRRDPADRQAHHGDRLAPAVLLAADRPEGESGHGDGDHQRPQPVEASGGLVVARFWYEPDGGE